MHCLVCYYSPVSLDLKLFKNVNVDIANLHTGIQNTAVHQNNDFILYLYDIYVLYCTMYIPLVYSQKRQVGRLALQA